MRKRILYANLLLLTLAFPLFGQDCCEDEDDDQEAPKKHNHFQLFYSGGDGEVEDEIPDARGDFEWPGRNDSAFYDYFTR